jgi:transcription-repair coupling factor (superfamily II helicase)
LAEQHGETCRKRFQPYPLEIRVLSRFKNPKEQKQILTDLAAGKVDIIIGTHRLLQKDVHFKDLGLLIVDEEQRFGVSHKEKLKQFRQTIDVLTLSATPIPRTLQMAMTGIREMSIINTPPADRMAIRTYLCRPEDSIIREAVQRELVRGGQVFFVHNRVQNLASYAAYIKRLVPVARVGMAHGQMHEKDLEDVMWQFWRREIDVLVCTAIIESGLDIPAANTIIINRAHALGLSQIYQLRGRVGRGREQAYAYLLVPEEEHLNPEAQKRLKALMEFTELGSGFKIALHDLQIRGAGNMLGAAQSGHIAEVGYELYLQLLEDEINRLKGEPRDQTPDPELHLPLAAYLPETYIPDIDQRLLIYRRLSGRLTKTEIDAIAEELLDCYGPLTPEAANLLEVVQAKSILRAIGIKRLDMNNGSISVTFADGNRIDRERLVAEVLKRPRRYQIMPDNQLRVRLPEGDPLERLKNFLKDINFFVIGESKTPSP